MSGPEAVDLRVGSARATVTVCSACLRASCWQGQLYCDQFRSAGTVEKTMAELQALGREHERYWGAAVEENNARPPAQDALQDSLAEVAALRAVAERWRALAGKALGLIRWAAEDAPDIDTEAERARLWSAQSDALLADPDGAAASAEWTALREREKALVEALVWCGGSADFGPGGVAYEGWRTVVAPLLEGAAQEPGAKSWRPRSRRDRRPAGVSGAGRVAPLASRRGGYW